MGRVARIVAPGQPHHVTQRGNRRMRTFFRASDGNYYIELMSQWCKRWEVEVWGYCLMPNHVHLIVVPKTEKGLARAIGEAHRRYAIYINEREGWKGHLWQERFASFVMDYDHLLRGIRYVELNPVRAGLAASAGAYRWSSARAHIEGRDDRLVRVAPLLEMVDDWEQFLAIEETEKDIDLMRKHQRTGRPLGSDTFLKDIEKRLGKSVRKRKPGPKCGNYGDRILNSGLQDQPRINVESGRDLESGDNG